MMKTTMLVVSFVIAFFGVQYGLEQYRDYAAVKRANEEIDDIREQAIKNNPDVPEVIAVQQAAVNKAKENIESQGSESEKQKTAAGNFFGFYLVNHRQRDEYCQNQGVDISSFIDGFADSHQAEYAMAIQAISGTPDDVDKLYTMLKPQLLTVIEQDMALIADANELSLMESCELIAKNAALLVPDMHISKMQPAVYEALMPNPILD